MGWQVLNTRAWHIRFVFMVYLFIEHLQGQDAEETVLVKTADSLPSWGSESKGQHGVKWKKGTQSSHANNLSFGV